VYILFIYISQGFNAKGRGYPDVAALGHNYPVFLGGKSYNVDGTSAASPVMAAMMALVNNERLLAGKKPLGLVTPLLYQLAVTNPEIFNDVVEGTNNCAAGGATKICCTNGFSAAKGTCIYL
jgi:tripeptidyl-peptidase-1